MCQFHFRNDWCRYKKLEKNKKMKEKCRELDFLRSPTSLAGSCVYIGQVHVSVAHVSDHMGRLICLAFLAGSCVWSLGHAYTSDLLSRLMCLLFWSIMSRLMCLDSCAASCVWPHGYANVSALLGRLMCLPSSAGSCVCPPRQAYVSAHLGRLMTLCLPRKGSEHRPVWPQETRA